jgi:hypothetical protein
VREQLGSAALEIDHRELVLDPEVVASSITAFLGLPSAAAARFSRYVCQSRPEQTDENFGAIYALHNLGLDEQEMRRLKMVCDPAMSAFGYGYDESYYINGMVEA